MIIAVTGMLCCCMLFFLEEHVDTMIIMNGVPEISNNSAANIERLLRFSRSTNTNYWHPKPR